MVWLTLNALANGMANGDVLASQHVFFSFRPASDMRGSSGRRWGPRMGPQGPATGQASCPWARTSPTSLAPSVALFGEPLTGPMPTTPR
eukprot:805249-Prorocentrum_lima.AAC.1